MASNPGFTRVILNGNPYDIPDQGTSPTYGEQIHDYLVDLNEFVGGLAGTYDVLNRLQVFNIAPTAYTDLSEVTVDPTVLNGAVLQYSIKVNAAATSVEVGQAYIVYDNNNPNGSKFDVARQRVNDAGVDIYVTDLGQVQVKLNSAVSGFTDMRMRVNLKAYEY